jgi:3-hydroxyacyl-[acyl-carrier-protein] dehydratase
VSENIVEGASERGIVNITDSIPHRPPFLLVDEVVEMTPTGDKPSIRTRRTVDPAEPCLKGHFPGFPLLPGVLVVEAVLQTGAVLIANLPGNNMEGLIPALTRLTNAKFKQMVRPGDVIEMHVTLIERMANAFFMEGNAKVNGKTAVSMEFACTAVPKPA